MTSMSIVVPVFSEASAIGQDVDIPIRTIEASGYEYEIIVE